MSPWLLLNLPSLPRLHMLRDRSIRHTPLTQAPRRCNAPCRSTPCDNTRTLHSMSCPDPLYTGNSSMRLNTAARSSAHFAQLAHTLGPAHTAYTPSEKHTSSTCCHDLCMPSHVHPLCSPALSLPMRSSALRAPRPACAARSTVDVQGRAWTGGRFRGCCGCCCESTTSSYKTLSVPC